MYKLEVPVDLKEAAVLQRRRDGEVQRQSRVFNARDRTIGVDKDALETQVRDKKTQEETEKKRQEAFDAQMVQNDKITCLLDERQKKDIRNLNKAINEFRLCFQKKEDRREFDLYDPQAFKNDLPARVSDNDTRCSVSGVQRLMGEDLTERNRRKAQQEQLREWSLQQQRELQKAVEDKKLADSLYDKHRIELDKKAMELQKMEEKARRDINTFTKDFNKAQAEESLERRQLEKQQEEDDNSVEISNLTEGDLLSENPAQAISAFGPHRIVPDRWKGMRPEQLEEIYNVQQQQKQEKMRLKEEERQRQAEWDRRRVQEARAMILLERQQKRQEKELRKGQDHLNLQLAQAHKAQKNYFDKDVFTNTPADAFFGQFNTISR
ncbi:PREDICTED: RIB43A-like with coiled-coils protein 2 [Nanorana parkeri]|uniref:RIB43A-like with coiled-coils protein 2 n=1 Tax=Nanorana parkeri TaxID=125878 RepID=UPI0008549064|nr:PREDICTED: RIB43A-like with coiled-coils protein 2 [Nanorana parkeri]